MPPESKKKQQLLTVDLQDLKPLVLEAAHCATQRPSSWVREVLAKALDVTAPRPAAAPAANLTKTDAPKLTLRLTRKDHERLGDLAREEGLTRSQWLLHRLRQPNAPAIPKAQVDELVNSNYQLAAVGRNLNQIARSLNAYPGRTTTTEREAIARAIAAVRAHLELGVNIVRALLQPARTRKPIA